MTETTRPIVYDYSEIRHKMEEQSKLRQYADLLRPVFPLLDDPSLLDVVVIDTPTTA